MYAFLEYCGETPIRDAPPMSTPMLVHVGLLNGGYRCRMYMYGTVRRLMKNKEPSILSACSVPSIRLFSRAQNNNT